jgi:hypothetical protein
MMHLLIILALIPFATLGVWIIFQATVRSARFIANVLKWMFWPPGRAALTLWLLLILYFEIYIAIVEPMAADLVGIPIIGAVGVLAARLPIKRFGRACIIAGLAILASAAVADLVSTSVFNWSAILGVSGIVALFVLVPRYVYKDEPKEEQTVR